MLHIQEFLSTHNVNQLQEQFGIRVRQHPQYPELMHFCYDQIESSRVKSHDIVRECRGLILNSADSWSVVAYPYHRFFNLGELEEPFDWSGVRVQEKVDGSHLILYFWQDRWNVATKGTPDANAPVGSCDFTFAQLFHQTWCRQFGELALLNLDTDLVYMFELTSQYNRVVTTQVSNPGRLTLTGVRNRLTLTEQPTSDFPELNPVREFSLNTPQQIQEAALALDPLVQEGYVLIDRHWRRLKVKSPRYVLIHHVKDSLNSQRIVELIQQGEQSEVLVYFPDLKIRYDEISQRYQQFADLVDQTWANPQLQALVSAGNRKNIAQWVTSLPQPGIAGALFALVDGKAVNGTSWLQQQMSARVVRILEDQSW